MSNYVECLAVIENNHLKVNHLVIVLIVLFASIWFLISYFNDVIRWYEKTAIIFCSMSCFYCLYEMFSLIKRKKIYTKIYNHKIIHEYYDKSGQLSIIEIEKPYNIYCQYYGGMTSLKSKEKLNILYKAFLFVEFNIVRIIAIIIFFIYNGFKLKTYYIVDSKDYRFYFKANKKIIEHFGDVKVFWKL